MRQQAGRLYDNDTVIVFIEYFQINCWDDIKLAFIMVNFYFISMLHLVASLCDYDVIHHDFAIINQLYGIIPGECRYLFDHSLVEALGAGYFEITDN